jgi:hypothetical protein
MLTFSSSDEQPSLQIVLPSVPWESLVGRLEQVAIAVMKLDARLDASGLAAGWQSRCDMTEAVRALILDGHLVDIGDVVLHDADMDVRSPTHELTRAATALRAITVRLARRAPWPLSIDGLAALRGIMPASDASDEGRSFRSPTTPAGGEEGDGAFPAFVTDADPWKAQFADIDALLVRTSKVLAGETPIRSSRSHLVYDPEIDEGENEDLWLDLVKRTAQWPAVAAAAMAWKAWLDLNLYPRQPWLGFIMAGCILRARGLTRHLLPLASGFRTAKFRPQGREGAAETVAGFCAVIEQAVAQGQKDLERLILARETMDRVTRTCRSNSKLPELVELFLSRPLVTVALGAKLLKVTPKAVDLMLVQLGGALPRELTGRRRYRAWGIV